MLLLVFTICVLTLHSLGFSIGRYRRQANGCGPANLNIDAFLKEIGEDILIQCCDQHDLCYDQCNKAQWTCDTTFLYCMIEACKCLLVSSNVNQCQNDAHILYGFVFFGGHLAYQRAQAQHNCNVSKEITNYGNIPSMETRVN